MSEERPLLQKIIEGFSGHGLLKMSYIKCGTEFKLKTSYYNADPQQNWRSIEKIVPKQNAIIYQPYLLTVYCSHTSFILSCFKKW